MGAKILTDLAIRLSTQNAELQKGVDRANKTLGSIKSNTENISGQVMGGLAKIGGAFLAVAGSVETFKKIMGSTQATGDEFEKQLEGAKVGTDNLMSSIATLDFDNLINGFISGYKAGKEYAATLDDIADKQVSLGIIEAETALAIKKQERILKSSTTTAEEKIAAEEEMRRLIEKQNQLQKKVASERRKAEEDLLASRYPGMKLTEEEIKLVTDYVRNYIYLTDEQKKAIEEVGEAQRKMIRARGAVGAYEEEPRVVRTTKAYNAAAATLDEVSAKYAKVANVLNLFTDEARQKWADLYKAEVAVDTETEELLIKADKGTTKVTKSIAAQIKEEEKLRKETELAAMAQEKLNLAKLKPISTANIAIPSLAPNLPTLDLAKMTPQEPMITAWKKLGEEIKNANLAVNALQVGLASVEDAFVGILSGAKGSLKGLVTAVLDATSKILQAFLAQAIAGVIASESKKGLVGLITASIGVSLLMALWKTKVPEFASGGLVYSPTNALVGEYPGAANNPEVIAPLDKLKQLIGGGGGVNGNVRFEIDGYKLVGILEKQGRLNRAF